MSKIINLKDEAERQFNSFVKEVQTERDQANCKHKSWLFDEDGEYMECAQCKKAITFTPFSFRASFIQRSFISPTEYWLQNGNHRISKLRLSGQPESQITLSAYR